MIELRLQFFAKTKAQQTAYRKTLAIRKQQQTGSKNLEDVMDKEKERKSSPPSSDVITNPEKISKKETYILTQVTSSGKEGKQMELTGKSLFEPLARETLVYDKGTKSWRWKTNKGKIVRFVIRRKR